jgi:hypothetical protein
MANKLRLLELFEGKRYQKIVLVISVLTFLVLELLIFMAAASQAGQKSRVIISDANGQKVFETTGSALTSYEKLVFENNYGPLSNFNVHVDTEVHSFPFRAWLAAAVGIPVGLILLVSFLIRVYLSLLYGEEKEKTEEHETSSPKKNQFISLFSSFHRISVFHLGFLLVMSVLLLWMVPNFLGDFARISLHLVSEYKWFFFGSAVFFGLLIVWIIYLRYKLSKQMLDNQLDLEKFRVEQQLLVQRESPHLLPHHINEAQEQ